MKTIKTYIDMIGHASTINTHGHFLTQETKNMSTPGSSKASMAAISTCHEFLIEGNHDLDDLAGNYRYEMRSKIDSRRDLEGKDLGWEVFLQLNDPVLGSSRIDVGYKHGLIDGISHSFIKTQEGWRNDDYEVVLPESATLEEVRAYISDKVRVVPTITLRDFEEAESTGQFFNNGRMIASKDENGAWVDHDTQRTFAEGELIRLIHHKNDPFVLMGGHPESQVFHGNVSQSNKAQSQFSVRKNSSFQGDCVYGTTSVDEAIRIYGNPRSFEIRNKLDRDARLYDIDPTSYNFGHLYELTSTAALFKASLEPKHISYNDLPSYSAFMLLARHTGLMPGFASNQWQEMKSAACTMDVYKTVSVFCSRVIQDTGNSNAFKQIFASLGFEGVEIVVPSKEQLTGYRESINELRELDVSEFKDRLINKESVINELENYVLGIQNSLPAKAQNSHVVVFDESLVESKHLTILPLHKHFVGKEDVLYNQEQEFSLEQIDQLVNHRRRSNDIEYS